MVVGVRVVAGGARGGDCLTAGGWEWWQHWRWPWVGKFSGVNHRVEEEEEEEEVKWDFCSFYLVEK